MEATKHQIENLNPKEIPLFLSNLSNAKKDPQNSNGNHNLFILKSLVSIQGKNIVPYITPFMSVFLQSIEFSHETSNFALHESCSWMTRSIARYGIELVPESEKIRVIGVISGPLSDSLMSTHKNVASVSAFCLNALVESDNWNYAASELVNQICAKVAGSLEEEIARTNTGTHLNLAISLVKKNPLVIEPYVRSLVKSGLFLLTHHGGSQIKIFSVKLINAIIKCVDFRTTSSEISTVVDVLEGFARNPLLGVNGVVFEALETAKNVIETRGRVNSGNSSPVFGLILDPKLDRDANWDTMEAKDERFFRSSGRRVDGFGYVNSDIVGLGSDGWRMARCVMHDRCDRCVIEKSTDQLHQRIRRRNSVDNLGTSFSPPKYRYSSSDQKQQSQFCHSTEKRTMCEACSGWKREQETKRRGEKRRNSVCNSVVLLLSLVLGVFAVVLAVILKGYLMDEDQGFPLAPT